MYKKFALALNLFLLLTVVCTVHAQGLETDDTWFDGVLDMTVGEVQEKREENLTDEVLSSLAEAPDVSSPERELAYDVLVNENAVFLDEGSREILCRIVEAESGTEDVEGRMLVANVVLNRVESARFPNTVKDVVFQRYQFSPVASGRYFRVNVTDKTREAVERVLNGEDYSHGALYFVNRNAAHPGAMSWFDLRCTFLFAHGRHEFFS